MNSINTQTFAAGMNSPVDKAAKLKREQDLKEAAAGFEAIYLNSLMKSMRKTLPGNGVFKSDNTSNIYQSMHDEYLTEKLSQGKQTIGLKEQLYEQLKDKI